MAINSARLTAAALVTAAALAGCASRPPAAARRSTPTTAITPAASRADVTVLDLSFVGLDDGWALAVSTCTDRAGQCPELLRTTNGAHWRLVTMLPFEVVGVGGCGDTCVDHLRFADQRIGYAFGVGAQYLTTDGGLHWTRQRFGAAVLETLDQNVLRVRPWTPCTLGCIYDIDESPIGATVLRDRSIKFTAYQVALARAGHDAYVVTMQHLSGNGFDDLYRSGDDGRDWTLSGEPCRPGKGVEVHSLGLSAAAGGWVGVLCWQRGSSTSFLASSSDSGAHFVAQPGTVPFNDTAQLAGGPTGLLAASGDELWRSSDGGQSWSRVRAVVGQVTFLGFESAKVGRVVTDNRTIWTTRDGGRSWTPARFG